MCWQLVVSQQQTSFQNKSTSNFLNPLESTVSEAKFEEPGLRFACGESAVDQVSGSSQARARSFAVWRARVELLLRKQWKEALNRHTAGPSVVLDEGEGPQGRNATPSRLVALSAFPQRQYRAPSSQRRTFTFLGVQGLKTEAGEPSRMTTTSTTTTTVKILPSPPCVMVLESLPAASVPVPVPVPVPVEGSPRRRKGKNFTPQEECTLCRSFLAVAQGSLVENGQKTASMWERVAASFNEKNQAQGLAPRSARSLESKWGTIKHDVSIFVDCHAGVESSNVDPATSEDVIEKALEVYKSKHPKAGAFIHLHCWRILHEVPQWCDNTNNGDDGAKVVVTLAKVVVTLAKVAAAAPAKVLPTATTEPLPEISAEEEEEEEPIARSQGDGRSEQPPAKKPRRVKVDKEAKAREGALRAQARAMADMAAASRMKAEILADQSALQLFTLPMKDVTEADAREYLMLRRQEEILKMRRRLLAQTAAPVDLPAPSPASPALPEQPSLKQPTTDNIALPVCSRCERQYRTS